MAKKQEAEKKQISKEESEALILDLAKKGMTSEAIGLAIKKEYGISPKKEGIDIGKILKKNNAYQDPDIINLKKNVEMLKKHMEKNKHDFKTKRILTIKEAKLEKLKKYRAR